MRTLNLSEQDPTDQIQARKDLVKNLKLTEQFESIKNKDENGVCASSLSGCSIIAEG